MLDSRDFSIAKDSAFLVRNGVLVRLNYQSQHGRGPPGRITESLEENCEFIKHMPGLEIEAEC